MARYVVYIMESERGWGQRVDEKKYFRSLVKANKFVEEYNAKNNLSHVPNWYMYATQPRLEE